MDLGKLVGFVLTCLIIGSMGQAQAQTAGFTRTGDAAGIGSPLRRVNVFSMTGEDNREQMQRGPGTGLRPIGAVYDARANGYGTAFLISPCHVLTNYHLVLPADRVATFNTGSDLTFYVGAPSGGQPYTSKTRARPVAWGDYTVNDGGRIRFRPREDWAVLKLDECLGARYGFMTLGPISAAEARILGPKLATAGFPGDHDHNILWGVRNCGYRESGFGAMWMHDCSTTEGSSGSPIFYRNADGHIHVVAIASAAARHSTAILSDYDSTYANGAVPIDGIYDRIRPYIETDTGPRPSYRY